MMPQKNSKTNYRLGKNICKDTTDKGLLSKTHTHKELFSLMIRGQADTRVTKITKGRETLINWTSLKLAFGHLRIPLI